MVLQNLNPRFRPIVELAFSLLLELFVVALPHQEVLGETGLGQVDQYSDHQAFQLGLSS